MLFVNVSWELLKAEIPPPLMMCSPERVSLALLSTQNTSNENKGCNEDVVSPVGG